MKSGLGTTSASVAYVSRNCQTFLALHFPFSPPPLNPDPFSEANHELNVGMTRGKRAEYPPYVMCSTVPHPPQGFGVTFPSWL